jgi:hypothetical protein
MLPPGSHIAGRPATHRALLLGAGLLLWALLVAAYRMAAAVAPDVSPIEREQRRLQRFVDALHAEGTVKNIALCPGYEACVRVTHLFQDLEYGDKRSIGALLRRYFEIHPTLARTVLSIRFMDAQTGVELGRYFNNGLVWYSG